ncbi:hypothetical protein BDZ89DRAFT_1125595 [Hymenopellis radicata]|nr:hypothetical protein BDZ89DRAFT_1125595 [Hymenopellis radicata]
MEGSICGINASVYAPLLQCLDAMDGAGRSQTSLASAQPGSTLSITQTNKFRPCLVLKANPKANYTTICLMATFGGADYDNLADITRRLVYPVQHNHPSFRDAPTICVTPVWPKDPQWMICWANNITTKLSRWSSDVPYSVDKMTVQKLRSHVMELRKNLIKDASADRDLKKRLHADLMRWKREHAAKGEGSIYSQAPNSSQGSLLSARSYASSSCSASTRSLWSIPEVSEGEDWDAEEVPTPTPTGTTFAGKLIKNLTRASRSSHHFLPRINGYSSSEQARDDFIIQDPPMKQTNASRVSVSSCRSQSSRNNHWAQGPPAIRAM